MEIEKKTIEIIDMDLSGRGIGKHDGKAVFIPHTVTGDHVAYETVASKKRYDIGRLCEIITPSAHRRLSRCPSFDTCGGCSFLHISRELELDIKRRSVESAFRRAGIKDVRVEKIISGNDRHYRNKAVFHLNKNGQYGFFSAESHSCGECDSCLLVPQIFNEIVRYSNKYFAETSSVRAPENIMLRIGNGDIMISVQAEYFGQYANYLDDVSSEFPEIKSCYECTGYPTDHTAEFKLYKGCKSIQTYFAKNKLNISPKSFFQVNSEIAELLCEEIAASLDLPKNGTVLDLYCGIGTIGLAIAKKIPDCNILGVEINESAVSDAVDNSKISGIMNTRFICSDAGHVDFSGTPPEAVIVDPPRYGLTDSMINSILRISPETLIYMSCDPSTLAGNSLKIMREYDIFRCIAADMFPGCPHVETLVVFTKR